MLCLISWRKRILGKCSLLFRCSNSCCQWAGNITFSCAYSGSAWMPAFQILWTRPESKQTAVLSIAFVGLQRPSKTWEPSPGWVPEIVLAQYVAGPATTSSLETCPVSTPLPSLCFQLPACTGVGTVWTRTPQRCVCLVTPCESLSPFWPYPLVWASATSFWQQFAEFDCTVLSDASSYLVFTLLLIDFFIRYHCVAVWVEK